MMLLATWSPITFAANFGLVVLSLAAIACLFRIWQGPSYGDVIVGLDLLALQLVGGLTLMTIVNARGYSLRVATILALVNFVGSIGFALYLRKSSTS